MTYDPDKDETLIKIRGVLPGHRRGVEDSDVVIDGAEAVDGCVVLKEEDDSNLVGACESGTLASFCKGLIYKNASPNPYIALGWTHYHQTKLGHTNLSATLSTLPVPTFVREMGHDIEKPEITGQNYKKDIVGHCVRDMLLNKDQESWGQTLYHLPGLVTPVFTSTKDTLRGPDQNTSVYMPRLRREAG